MRLSREQIDILDMLYAAGEDGLDFGEDPDYHLFVVEEIDWLIRQGLVEKTGDYIFDRTYWRLNEDGMDYAESILDT